MAWRDVMGDGAPRIAESPLDSARFGRAVERLTVPSGAVSPFTEVREAVLGSSADVIVLRYPAEHVGWFAELTALGRTAVFADSLTYWRLHAGRGRAPEPPEDLQVTERVTPAVVRESISDFFASYGNHYLANPLFDAAGTLAGYREWALRLAAEGTCLAMRRRGPDGDADPGAPPDGDPDPGAPPDGVLALAMLSYDGPRMEIVLAGVTPRARGNGLYTHLLAAIERHALARGVRELVTSTQAHNTGGQRAWARYGFEPVQAFVTVHLIRSPLPRGRRR
ncbi:GNAT family N-acetyltransferase [Streptosporangium sp. V21-05]|uniref:GNAT family N-acetyltransferase n=1 Tax=Streptosporangium sp. V21-05 TaxID=3446115 RepID=UPI003F535B99